MEEKIYIVFNYGSVGAVFKNKEKAEQYCKCHENTIVEEYFFDDSKTFTPFNIATAEFMIDISCLSKDKFDITFQKKCIEETYDYYLKNNGSATFDRRASISSWFGQNNYDYYIYGRFYKILPDSFSEDTIKDEMFKTFQDLKEKFTDLLSKYRNNSGTLIMENAEVEKIDKVIKNIIRANNPMIYIQYDTERRKKE